MTNIQSEEDIFEENINNGSLEIPQDVQSTIHQVNTFPNTGIWLM